METLPRPHAERALDVVYRARNLPFNIGHHGQLKHRIAEIVDPAARAHGLRTDISTRIADTKYGDAWFEFLASGRCVIGTESGSSALDPYGELRRFEADGAPSIPTRPSRSSRPFSRPAGTTTASPPSARIFEAAQTKTAQLLVEGEYDGILAADTPLRAAARGPLEPRRGAGSDRRPGRDGGLRRARLEDLILSGRYSYGAFAAHVETVVEEVAGDRAAARLARRAGLARGQHDGQQLQHRG